MPADPCLSRLAQLDDDCGPLLGDDEGSTMTQGCCETLREMNAPDLRCFCRGDVLDVVGDQIRPLRLLAPFLCGPELEIVEGDACQPVAPEPTLEPPAPLEPSPPPPEAPVQVPTVPLAPAPPPPDAPIAPAPPPPDAPIAPAPLPPDAPIAPAPSPPDAPIAPAPPPPDAPLAPSPPPPPSPAPPNACPSISLLGFGSGPERNEVAVGTVWIDHGAIAYDPEDGDLTDRVERDASELDTNVPGVYRVTYRARDSAGCEAVAVRFVRVVALVATSDPLYLRQLCLRSVPTVALACEGARAATTSAPLPASFSACCLVVSEMDAAACFCDGAVVSALEKALEGSRSDAADLRSIATSANATSTPNFDALRAFTPMACGFAVKTGAVCTDARTLETFLANETRTALALDSGAPARDVDAVASVEAFVTRGGALDENLPCEAQIETATVLCRRLTAANARPFAPAARDYAPCCAAAAALNQSRCLCAEPVAGTETDAETDGDGARARETFLRRLVGFAPLGCGFALTSACPESIERTFELPATFAEDPGGLLRVRPAALEDDAAWRALAPPGAAPARPEDWGETDSAYEAYVETDPGVRDVFSVLEPGSVGDTAWLVNGERARAYEWVSCDEYVSYAASACASARLDENVSAFEITDCCAALRAARARGCACAGLGSGRFEALNEDLPAIARAACGVGSLATAPKTSDDDDSATCRATLALADVLAPASATRTRERGEDDDDASSSAFFAERNVTFASLASVAARGTPIVVADPGATVRVRRDSQGAGPDADADPEPMDSIDLPVGSVLGALAADAPGASDLAALAGAIEPGATYRVPASASIVADVVSAEDETDAVRVDVAAGGAEDGDDETGDGNVVVVVTAPDPDAPVAVPWPVALEPAPAAADAAARPRDPLPYAVALAAPEGRATLVPRGSGARDDPAALAALADAVADLEGASSRAARDAGGLLFAGEATRPAVPGFGDTRACVAALLLAESACLSPLERVVDEFELDLGWRACCDGVRAVAEKGCYCDGAAARALETSSRADAHSRVVDAVRGACGLDVTAASRREACPLVRVSRVNASGDASAEAGALVTFLEAPAAALVSAAGEAYSEDDEGSVVSVVAGSGGAIFAVEDADDSTSTPPRPLLAIEPQPGARSVAVAENLVVSYENAAVPGVTFEIDPTAAEAESVAALFRNGTATVRATDVDADDTAEGFFALAVTPEGALEASSASASTAVPLAGGEGAAAAINARLGLEATFETEDGRVAVATPDGVVVSAANRTSSATSETSPPPIEGPRAEGETTSLVGVDAFGGPSVGERGVVARDGAAVRPPENETAAEADGACAGIREVKNFLTTSLEPGSTSFTVVGAVSCCAPTNVSVPELAVPIKYLPRGGDAGESAPPTSPPEAECLGAVVVDALGAAVSEDLCDRVVFEDRPYGLDAVFADIEICADCSVAGRASDGAMFRVSHRGEDTLRAMRPAIDRLQCDARRVEARGGPNDSNESTPTSTPTSTSLSTAVPLVSRSADQRGRGRSLLQFLNPFGPLARARAFSDEREVSEYFERLAAAEEGTGTTVSEERTPDAESDAAAAEFGTDDRGGRYGVPGDGGPVPLDTDGEAYADDAETRAARVNVAIETPDARTCEDEVSRLANDVRWRSDGAGPLEPGLPNEPYDEYVFAGSVDVLAAPQSEEASAEEETTARLAGIVLPVVFSPWVLDADGAGDWRAALDPAAEFEVACFGAATRRPDGATVPNADPCGGLGFALSTFEPERQSSGNGDDGDDNDVSGGPAAILLEVTFTSELCAGCRLVGGGARGELFRVRHARGASLDFVGPTVGALECAPGGPVGTNVEAVSIVESPSSDADPGDDSASPDDRASPPSPASRPAEAFVAQGEDRNVSSCDGRAGLNLKGEVLNDGNELIKGAAADCCWECKQDPRCNVWVYCEGDCVTFAYHSCWLKRASVTAEAPPDAWAANPDVPWTSGWFPPKRGVARAQPPPPQPQPPEPEETAAADSPGAPQPPAATPTPTIRVVPVGAGAVQPPAPTPAPAVLAPSPSNGAGAPAFRAPEARGEAPEPPRRAAPRPPPAAANVTLVPGEPAVIPDSVITLLPARDETPAPAPDASACGDDAAAVCPSASADPLAAANVRGSFQLLRERTTEDAASSSASRLTLLRPNEAAREIFVTGTLINAGDAPACLGGLELVFDFPRAVVDPDTGRVVVAPPEDFVVRCFYVGVRSREASAAPGTLDRAGAPAPPRACDDVVKLRMTETGPVAAFEADVALCPGCWLVGGRDGVLFSWKHRDAERFAMAARSGDAVGYAGARCAPR